MQKELFEKSLNDEIQEDVKIYRGHQLFYVAFLGGMIPTIALFTRNAKWLNKDKWITIGIGILAGLILLAKIIAVGLALNGALAIELRYIKYGYRIGCVLIYLCYNFFMKASYKQHYILGGEHRPLLKDAITWIVVGMVAETILLISGRFIVGVFI